MTKSRSEEALFLVDEGRTMVSPRRDLLTMDEVRSRLRLSRAMVYALVNDGSLPCVRIGRRVFVIEDDLNAFIASRRVPAKSA